MATREVWKEFSENEITHSGAHHLLAILELIQNRGYARVTDVARFLEITTGSASTNLKALKNKGLVIEDENRFISLSVEGSRLAESILHCRQILIDFFRDVLKVGPEQAEIDACKTEHLFSLETIEAMSAMLPHTAASTSSPNSEPMMNPRIAAISTRPIEPISDAKAEGL